MLRWLIAILVLANVLAFVAMRGVFGPLPSSGPREPERLNQQIYPEELLVTPLSAAEAVNPVVVGGPVPASPVAASELAP